MENNTQSGVRKTFYYEGVPEEGDLDYSRRFQERRQLTDSRKRHIQEVSGRNPILGNVLYAAYELSGKLDDLTR
ncbi:MAG TPA: hypothetical protein P5277_00380 [Candidatus Paceibacterota bacterium]|nr:hypothetical protein [Candidatus Paceibacterota bacterium]